MRYIFPVCLMIACDIQKQHTEQLHESQFSCTPQQGAPYPNGIPYLGIHADAGNSDIIHCRSADEWESSWFSLQDLGMTQPNTFSPPDSRHWKRARIAS